ncbi:hypothetical protein Trydic_g12587 [Trypoxylus dichotomus]
MWSNLAEELNAAGLEKGLLKSGKSLGRILNGTGGGPQYSKHLTQLELRFLSVLGSSFAEGAGVPERGMKEVPNKKKRGKRNR